MGSKAELDGLPSCSRPALGRQVRRSTVAMIATGDRPYRSLRGALHSVTVVPVLFKFLTVRTGVPFKDRLGPRRLIWSGRGYARKDPTTGLIGTRVPQAVSPVGDPRLGE